MLVQQNSYKWTIKWNYSERNINETIGDNEVVNNFLQDPKGAYLIATAQDEACWSPSVEGGPDIINSKGCDET